jgi:CRISPR/Cas system CMR-associated protein Cmr1 (group 7 of RAMP superfamily)
LLKRTEVKLTQKQTCTYTLENSRSFKKPSHLAFLAVSSFNETKTIIGNKPALQIKYTFKGIGATIRQGLNSLIINDDIGFSIVFTTDKKSYDKYFPTTQKMIDSFQLKQDRLDYNAQVKSIMQFFWLYYCSSNYQGYCL